MIVAKHTDIPDLLNYLEQDVSNCLYLYADISVYGLDNPNMLVWYESDERGICKVAMKYHDSFQLYADRNLEDIEGFTELIERYQPSAITARPEIAGQLSDRYNDTYMYQVGAVFEGKTIQPDKEMRLLEDCNATILRAQESDAREIAELMFSDAEMGAQYTVESLTEQLTERFRTGMGRGYIIRDQGRIVAHDGTFAECDKFVIESGLVVHPDYKNTLYVNWILNYESIQLSKENKKNYFFTLVPKLIRFHKRTSIYKNDYGRLTRYKQAQI